MTIRVRQATAADREAFLDLWMQHLGELERYGCEIAPTERSRQGFGEQFDVAISGGGVALVAEVAGAIVGVHLSRIADFPWDLSLGKTALAWGTFVLPDLRRRGVASALREASLAELSKKGIRTVLLSHYPGNTPGEESFRRWSNARQLHTTYAYELEVR